MKTSTRTDSVVDALHAERAATCALFRFSFAPVIRHVQTCDCFYWLAASRARYYTPQQQQPQTRHKPTELTKTPTTFFCLSKHPRPSPPRHQPAGVLLSRRAVFRPGKPPVQDEPRQQRHFQRAGSTRRTRGRTSVHPGFPTTRRRRRRWWWWQRCGQQQQRLQQQDGGRGRSVV